MPCQLQGDDDMLLHDSRKLWLWLLRVAFQDRRASASSLPVSMAGAASLPKTGSAAAATMASRIAASILVHMMVLAS